MELYNRYRFTYEVLIVAILHYILELVPSQLLEHPLDLMAMLDELNPGFGVLVHFLFDFALPWLGFRQAIRAHDCETMDSMYTVTLAWFYQTNKNNYARICVDHIYLKHALIEPLQPVRTHMCTVSLLGRNGHDVAADQANEFQNLWLKEMAPDSPQRIDEDLTILNGLKETDAQFRTMLDMERTPDGNYKFAKPNHINAVIGVLKESLGTTWEHIIGENRKKSSPFGGAVPWKQVLKVSSGEQGPTRNEFIAYIDHQLSNPPDSLHQP